ncbi:MAG: cadherin-like domain-containing protein [Acidobacteria bacterium]|nr:cadherin-like domain-containing protein [Acidobacteriota bacterium]
MALVLALGSVGLAATVVEPAAALLTQSPNCGSTIGLRNGDFETPVIAAGQSALTPTGTAGLIWDNSVENLIEQWSNGFQGRAAFSGAQFVEMNAYQAGSLYQDLTTVPGSTMVWRIAHRARDRDGETMRVRIGAVGSAPNSTSPALVANLVGPDRNGWTVHSGTYTVPAGQTTTRFAFVSDVTTTSAPGSGNFLDDIEFAFTAGACSDAVTTTAGVPVVVDVLANDVGAGLSVASIDTVSGGTAIIDNGRVRFTPSAGFSGVATFRYSVRDAAGYTSSATSTVDVLPVGVDDTGTTVEGAPVSIAVLANDLGLSRTITGVTTPTHGTATVVGGTAITYTPTAGFLGTDTFTYRASAAGGSYEATVTVTVTASADLAIGLSAGSPVSPLAGAEVSVVALVANDGPSAAGGTATINLPIGLTFISGAGCSAAAQVVTCPVPTLAGSGVTSFRLLLRATTEGTRTISAQIIGSVADPVVSNNIASRAIVVRPAADLAVTGSVAPVPLVPGTGGTWTFITTNNGPSAAAGSQIMITVDPTKLAAPRTASAGCVEAPAGTFTCTLGAIASGASVTTTLSGVVDAGVSTAVAATAVVSSTTTDPNTGNNAEIVSDVVSPTADLSVAATALAATVDPGGIATFGFEVTNLGPSVAHGVRLEIPIPADYEVTGVPTNCSVDGTTRILCGIGLLDVSGGTFSNSSGDLIITGRVRPTSGPSLALGGTASMNPSVTDPVPANNTATATSAVDVRADLAVVTGLSLASPVPGRSTDLLVSVFNDGPSAAVAPVVTVTVPATFGGFSTTDGACTPTSATVITCTLADLGPGSTRHLLLSGTFAPDASGSVTFTTSAASSTLDPVPGNNTSVLNPTLDPEADLAISGHASPSPFVGGASGTYELTITNDGPSTAVGMVVTLGLDVDLTGVAAGICSGTPVVTCTLAGPLAPGGTTTLSVAVTIAAAPSGSISSTAAVAASTADPDASNNSVVIDDSTVRTADIAVTAVFATAEVVPGASGSAVFTIANNGPSATAVTPVRVTMPAGFVLTDVNGTGLCNPTLDPAVVVCDLGPLPVGDAVELLATFDVDAGTADIPTPTVTAEAIDSLSPDTAAAPVIIDPVSANNRDTIAYALAPAADLAIGGTAPELFRAGPGIDWNFTVDNLGPTSTGFITMRVTVPDGAVLTAATELFPGHGATPTWGGPVVCTASGVDTLDCELAALGAGESLDVTLTFDMTDVGEGAVAVTGAVGAALPDPDGTNNSVTLVSGAVAAPVDPGPDPGTLPITGTGATSLVHSGLLLGLGGLVLLGLSMPTVRRRRRLD